MIKSEKGSTWISGSTPTLLADLTCIVSSLRETLIENFGEEEADSRIEGAIASAKKSDEELREMAQEIFSELLKKTLDDIAK